MRAKTPHSSAQYSYRTANLIAPICDARSLNDLIPSFLRLGKLRKMWSTETHSQVRSNCKKKIKSREEYLVSCIREANDSPDILNGVTVQLHNTYLTFVKKKKKKKILKLCYSTQNFKQEMCSQKNNQLFLVIFFPV